MAYPWYATGSRFAGSNGRAAYSVEVNCETDEKRFKVDVLQSGKKLSASAKTLADAQEKILKKRQFEFAVLQDLQELVDLQGQLS